MLAHIVLLTLSAIAGNTVGNRVQRAKKSPPQIIRIHAQGGSPFDSDILLPYSILQSIYQQQLSHKARPFNAKIRAIISPQGNSRISPPPRQFPHRQSPRYRQSRSFLSNVAWASATSSLGDHGKAKMRFEKDPVRAKSFKLYDDDGEHLLDMDDLSQPPTIANVTTSIGASPAGIFGSQAPKKVIKHVWISL